MVKKIDHYSIESCATIYDEEALTALQLAGRTAAKVNECVEAVNGIPAKVAADVEAHIKGGTFDEQIDAYAGNMYAKVGAAEDKATRELAAVESTMNARISNIARLAEGSTTGDAELIDGRTNYFGTTKSSIGDAIRDGEEVLLRVAKNVCVDLNVNTMGAINFDTSSKTVSGKPNIFMGQSTWKDCTPTAANFDQYWGIYTLWLSYTDGALYFKSIDESPASHKDIALCFCYLEQGAIRKLYGDSNFMKFVTVNDVPYLKAPFGGGSAVGENDMVLNVDTKNKTITLESGLIFFDRGVYVTGSGSSCDISEIFVTGGTFRIVLDANNNIQWRHNDQHTDTDKFLCSIWFTTTGVRYVYGHPDIVKNIRVNGVANNAEDAAISDNAKAIAGVFQKVVCCGDSYVAGDTQAEGHDYLTPNSEYAWVHHCGRITGCEWVGCGQSGKTAGTWLTAANGLPLVKSAGKAQAYMVGLGINDYLQNVEIGTTSDIGTANSTFIRNMGKIVSELRSYAPNAHIFLLTVADYTDCDAYSEAVRNVATHFRTAGDAKVHLLDLRANIALYGDLHRDSTGHPNAIGQAQSAGIFLDILGTYMEKNHKAFEDIPYIEFA